MTLDSLGTDAALQVALVIAAVWVAYETRVLRFQGGNQLDLLRQQTEALDHQLRITSVPDTFLVGTYPMDLTLYPPREIPTDPELVAKVRMILVQNFLNGDTSTPKDEKAPEAELLAQFFRSEYAGSVETVIVCVIQNPSQIPANSLYGAIYDPRSKRFLTTPFIFQTIRGGQGCYLPFLSSAKDVDTVIAEVRHLYGNISAVASDHLHEGDEW